MAFDAEGRWDRAYSVQGGIAVLEAADITARAKRMTVVDLGPVIDAKERMEAHRWKPTQAEIDRVMLDLLGGNHPRRRHIPYVKPVQHGKANCCAPDITAHDEARNVRHSRRMPSGKHWGQTVSSINNIAGTSRLPQADAMSHALFRLLKIAKVRREHLNVPSTTAQAGMGEQAFGRG